MGVSRCRQKKRLTPGFVLWSTSCPLRVWSVMERTQAECCVWGSPAATPSCNQRPPDHVRLLAIRIDKLSGWVLGEGDQITGIGQGNQVSELVVSGYDIRVGIGLHITI